MKRTFLAIGLGLLSACVAVASGPSDQFNATGFSRKNVFGCCLKVSIGPSSPPREFPSSKVLLEAALDGLSKAQPPKTKEVDATYELTLLTGSSFESQKLVIYMDSGGNGYFRHGRKPVVYFHSDSLRDALAEATAKRESVR